MELITQSAIARIVRPSVVGHSPPRPRTPEQRAPWDERPERIREYTLTTGIPGRQALAAAVWYRWVATLGTPDTPPRLDLYA